MLRPIFYKEFIKTRWLWLTLLGLNGLVLAYVYIDTRHLFAMEHAEVVWYQVMQLGRMYYRPLKYALVLTGAVMAFIQYLPEMTGERLRLALHLPIPAHGVVLAHVLVGLGAVGLVLLMDLGVLAWITAGFLPAESVHAALWTALPWGLAGLASYLGVTLGLLEPAYGLKLFNLAVAAGVAGLFLQPLAPGAYVTILPALAGLAALMVPAVLLPAYRFRYRSVC